MKRANTMVRTAEEGRKWIESQPAMNTEEVEEGKRPSRKRKEPETNPNVSPKQTRSKSRTSPQRKESPKKKESKPKATKRAKNEASSSSSSGVSSASPFAGLPKVLPEGAQLPRAGGRVFFTGALIGDHFISGTFSEVYVEDSYSEYVGEGRYPNNRKAFPKAIAASFDGIAIDAGTKVTIYSKPNFEGDILYQREGPAVVCNEKWKQNKDWDRLMFGSWKEPLNTIFPPACREWSATDMHQWDNGSLVIESGSAMPQEVLVFPEYALEHEQQQNRYSGEAESDKTEASSK